MKIEWKDKGGKLIDEGQSRNLDEFYKCFVKDGRVFKEETYLDRKLYGFRFHNLENHNHEHLLDQFNDPNQSDLEFCIIDYEQYANGCRLEILTSYSDEKGSVRGKTYSLFNAQNDMIGHEVFLEEDHQLKRTYVRKYYFDKTINPHDALCQFTYQEESGELMGFSFSDPGNFGDSFFSNSEDSIRELEKRIDVDKDILEYYLIGRVRPGFTKVST